MSVPLFGMRGARGGPRSHSTAGVAIEQQEQGLSQEQRDHTLGVSISAFMKCVFQRKFLFLNLDFERLPCWDLVFSTACV